MHEVRERQYRIGPTGIVFIGERFDIRDLHAVNVACESLPLTMAEGESKPVAYRVTGIARKETVADNASGPHVVADVALFFSSRLTQTHTVNTYAMTPTAIAERWPIALPDDWLHRLAEAHAGGR